MTRARSTGPAKLVELLAGGESGELIFSAGRLEVHVLVTRGRIAWATDSAHPLELARRIRERRGLEADVLAEVVAECRTTRQPFGATLVAWGLATWEDVREALVHQIRTALGELAASAPGSVVFLARAGFADYDSQLTFGLDELVEGSALLDAYAKPSAPALAARREPTGAGALLDRLPGASSVTCFADGHPPDAAGEARDAAALEAVRAALDAGATIVVHARRDDAVVGARAKGAPRAVVAAGRAVDARRTLARLARAGFGPPPPPALASTSSARPRPTLQGDAAETLGEGAVALVGAGLGVRAVVQLDASGATDAAVAADEAELGRTLARIALWRPAAVVAPGSDTHDVVLGLTDAWLVGRVRADGTSSWVVAERALPLAAAGAALTAAFGDRAPTWLGGGPAAPPLDFVQRHA